MTENPALLTRSGLGFYSVLLAVSLILSKLAEQMDRWYTAAGPDLEAQLAVGVGVGALGVWLSRLAERRIPGVQALAADFANLLRGLSRIQAWILALASGIAEEAFFRGTLQPFIGLVPTTLLFGFIHIGPARRYLWWTASALMYGLVLGLLFEWGGGLVAPVTAHVVLNAVNLYQLARRPVLAQPRAPAAGPLDLD